MCNIYSFKFISAALQKSPCSLSSAAVLPHSPARVAAAHTCRSQLPLLYHFSFLFKAWSI